MIDPQRRVWQPNAHQIEAASIGRLIARLGFSNYEDLFAFSQSNPAAYWNAVMAHCAIVWQTPPQGYVDASRAVEVPRWFPGGRLNWVETVLQWSENPKTAGQLAVVAEREDGSIRSLTYAQLDEHVRTFAAGLAAHGLARGERIGLLMENGIEATVSMLAIAWLGAIAVPLFSGFGVDAIVARLSSSEARAVIASTGFGRRGKRVEVEAALRTAYARLPAVDIVVWKHEGERHAAEPGQLDWQAVFEAGASRPAASAVMEPNDPFMVIYTSGTTGKPKGAVHTHGGFPLKIAHDAAVHFDVEPGDVFCWPADMGWIAGTLVLGCALLRGATLVCYDGAPDFPDWSRMSRLVERHRITHFGSAPTLIRGLASNAASALQGDRSSLQLLITAGEGIDPEHFCWFQEHFGSGGEPLINYTGGTEVSGALLSSVVVRPIRPSGFNTISPGVDVDVVDSTGASITEAVGELVVRRPFVGMTASFWKDDARFLETYWRTLPGMWMHGDLARRTAEGDFFMMGRSDDTIKLAGKRLGPAEVEEILLELPEVAEAAAIGVDDAAKGQKLVVFVVADQAHAAAPDLPLRVQRHVDERLGRPFRPGMVHVVTQLPKTRSSKIMRRVLRSVYCGLPPGDLSALDNPAALEEIRLLVMPA
ncbi:Acetyl-coenzyme A synthetase [Variovorax sp. PBS-H4]|uniref:AMP-binding protein n=1 Tax=Variovorax sp. PBS-H4 TaxID=434008 RepID=UPI001318805E|nr:AMP-binding protein [Variovorax sp. PBS-H4]VTU25497.1 Acetyl-coenzyme A synthetase [Variovorax sp. PBS-H4]